MHTPSSTSHGLPALKLKLATAIVRCRHRTQQRVLMPVTTPTLTLQMACGFHSFPIQFSHSEGNRAQQRPECAKVDAQSLHWLRSSTSNAFTASHLCDVSSATRYLPGKYGFALVASLHQQIEPIKPFVPSPSAESKAAELELYCRALSLLCGHLIVKCSNEQVKMALYSMYGYREAVFYFSRDSPRPAVLFPYLISVEDTGLCSRRLPVPPQWRSENPCRALDYRRQRGCYHHRRAYRSEEAHS
ncbi:hypothetical protein IW262DRAFT_176145 [Armillaria fumosa]|nr:hypothetical protein IW262DRAFT_176145 [Armillaria fumosa]